MNAKKGLSILAILFIAVEGILAFVPLAYADAIVVSTAVGHSTATTAAGSGSLGNIFAGNVIVVEADYYSCTAGVTLTAAVTDSQSNTYTQIVSQVNGALCGANENGYTAIFLATVATSQTSDTVTLTLSGCSGATCNEIQTYVQQVSGVSQVLSSPTNTGSGASASVASTSFPSVSFIAGTVLFGAGTTSCAAAFTCVSATSNFMKAEYSIDTQVATPTSFGFSTTVGSQWTESAVVLQAAASTTTGTGTQNLGSCPTKDVSTFTLANSTVYFYAGTALGSSTPASASTFLASITGSVSQTLYLSIYATPASGGVSVSNPLTRLGYQAFTISSGTKNSPINWNTAVTAITLGATWAVGVSGDNKLVLNQSTTAGVTSQTFVAGFVGGAGFFTSLGSASTNLYLCATSNFQLGGTTTTTTTTASSTVVTTSTSTVLTVGTGLLTSASNLPVIFLILLLPAGLFLGITKNLAGGLVGLLIGAVIGELMGILPIWAFTGLVISLIALAFVVSRRGE